MAFKDLSTENQGKVKILNAILEKKLEGLDYKNPEHRAEIMAVRSDVKNHEYYLDFKKDMSFCGALAKNNTICTAVPHMKEDGSTNGRCQKHGGKSTGAKTEEGKKRSLAQLKRRTPVHGLTTERLWNELTNEEKDYLEWFEESVKEQFVIENAIEETSLRMMAFEAVKHFRMINTQPFRETKTGMQMVQKFLRFIEVQGWRRRDLDEEQRKGVSVDTMMKLLNELDEEKKPSSQNNIKRIK